MLLKIGIWLLSKLSIRGVILVIASSALLYLIIYSKEFISDLQLSVLTLSEQNSNLYAQNEKVLAITKRNELVYFKLQQDIKVNDSITELLIKKIKGIQDVKITEKTIIQQASGNCLDTDYPDTIINSGVLRWEENSIITNSN